MLDQFDSFLSGAFDSFIQGQFGARNGGGLFTIPGRGRDGDGNVVSGIGLSMLIKNSDGDDEWRDVGVSMPGLGSNKIRAKVAMLGGEAFIAAYSESTGVLSERVARYTVTGLVDGGIFDECWDVAQYAGRMYAAGKNDSDETKIAWEWVNEPVTQVDTVQITSFDAATTYTLTIGAATVNAVGVTDEEATAAALAEAWNASISKAFTVVTASSAGDTVTLTADEAGHPFTTTSSVTGGAGTIGAVTNQTPNIRPWINIGGAPTAYTDTPVTGFTQCLGIDEPDSAGAPWPYNGLFYASKVGGTAAADPGGIWDISSGAWSLISPASGIIPGGPYRLLKFNGQLIYGGQPWVKQGGIGADKFHGPIWRWNGDQSWTQLGDNSEFTVGASGVNSTCRTLGIFNDKLCAVVAANDFADGSTIATWNEDTSSWDTFGTNSADHANTGTSDILDIGGDRLLVPGCHVWDNNAGDYEADRYGDFPTNQSNTYFFHFPS